MLMVPSFVEPGAGVVTAAGELALAALGAAGKAAEGAGSLWARTDAEASTASVINKRISVGFMGFVQLLGILLSIFFEVWIGSDAATSAPHRAFHVSIRRAG